MLRMALLQVSSRAMLPDMDTTANGLIAVASGFAESEFNERGEVFPVWLAFNDTNEFIITPGGGGKDDVTDALRTFFAVKHVTSYVFFDESWYLDGHADQISDEEMQRAYAEGDLAHHPKRREGVMFCAEDRNGQVMGRRAIVRKVNSKARLGPLDLFEGGEMEGRMTGLLPVPDGQRYH